MNDKPKRGPLSAYNLFFKTQREKYRNLNGAEVVKIISAKWKKLSELDRKPFLEAAILERERYRIDLMQYKAQVRAMNCTTRNLCRKKSPMVDGASINNNNSNSSNNDNNDCDTNDNNNNDNDCSNKKPKRGLTAFNLFLKSELQKAQCANSHINHSQRIKQISIKWNNLSDDDRKPFLDAASIDQERYRQELAQWKAENKQKRNTEAIASNNHNDNNPNLLEHPATLQASVSIPPTATPTPPTAQLESNESLLRNIVQMQHETIALQQKLIMELKKHLTGLPLLDSDSTTTEVMPS